MLYRGRNKKMKPACIYIVTYTKPRRVIFYTNTHTTHIVYKNILLFFDVTYYAF